jgi:hypothetical protein
LIHSGKRCTPPGDTLAAILLDMIATAADPEYGVTSAPAAKPLTENIFGGLSHLHPKAGLDRWPPIMSA